MSADRAALVRRRDHATPGETPKNVGGLQVFESIVILTSGGPGDATRSVVMYMLSELLEAGDMSTGSVAALTLLVVIAVFTALQFFLSRRWVFH